MDDELAVDEMNDFLEVQTEEAFQEALEHELYLFGSEGRPMDLGDFGQRSIDDG